MSLSQGSASQCPRRSDSGDITAYSVLPDAEGALLTFSKPVGGILIGQSLAQPLSVDALRPGARPQDRKEGLRLSARLGEAISDGRLLYDSGAGRSGELFDWPAPNPAP